MKAFVVVLGVSVFAAGCASHHSDRRAAARGALVGAAGGALVSSIAGGDPWTGAAAGAAGGAALGYITSEGQQRQVHRDRHGRDYWIDDRGRWRYTNEGRR